MSIVYTSPDIYDPYSITLTPVDTVTPLTLSPVTKVTTYTPLNTVTLTPVSPISSVILTTDNDAPYKTSLNLTYSQPIVGVYENLNIDPKIHKRMTKYYFYKAIEKWLYEDLIDVLNYLQSKDGKIDVLSDIKNYNPVAVDNDSDDVVNKKIDFIAKYFLNKRMVHKYLKEFVKESGVNWVDLPKNEYFLKDLFKKKLTRALKSAIAEKKS